MQEYTNEQVLEFMAQQELNFKNTAKRSGYEGSQAKKTLTLLASQSQEERIANARIQLSKLSK